MAFGAELVATEYGRIGLEFAQALIGGHYQVAHAMLTQELQQKWPVDKLKERLERMIQRGVVDGVVAEEGYDDYTDKPDGDIGGVYVSIYGHDATEPLFTFSEAVMIFVRRDDEGPRIREISWGRP